MTIGSAILQGLIQGLTEFLPISSSGHLSLYQYFTGQNGSGGFFFSIVLHLGTLIAVFIAFHKTIIGLIAELCSVFADIVKRRFSIKKASPRRRMLFLLFVALLPLLASFFLRKVFAGFASDDGIIIEGVCFLITSLLLFASLRCPKGTKNARTATYKDALVVGAFQAIAPMPGISRSGSTISAGIFIGMERKFAVAFSFILGILPVLGANILEINDAVKEGLIVPLPALLAGLLTSIIFGLLAIKMVNWLVTSDKFKYFAWYTLILGCAVVVIGIIEHIANQPVQRFIMAVLAGLA